jgi:hypothetical protein
VEFRLVWETGFSVGLCVPGFRGLPRIIMHNRLDSATKSGRPHLLRNRGAPSMCLFPAPASTSAAALPWRTGDSPGEALPFLLRYLRFVIERPRLTCPSSTKTDHHRLSALPLCVKKHNQGFPFEPNKSLPTSLYEREERSPLCGVHDLCAIRSICSASLRLCMRPLHCPGRVERACRHDRTVFGKGVGKDRGEFELGEVVAIAAT